MKIGILGARLDNGGLGIQARNFAKHIQCERILAFEIGGLRQEPDAYAPYCKNVTVEHSLGEAEISKFCKGLDLVFGAETLYNPHSYLLANMAGAKTALQLNYEWLPDGGEPSLFMAPSPWHFHDIPGNKVLLPVPCDTSNRFERRNHAKRFLFNAGSTDAAWDRNGWQTIKHAIPLVKSDVKFIVKSQRPVDKIDDPRVTYIVDDVADHMACYYDADVLLFPRRYGGLSLVLQEAMTTGMVVIASDMMPQNRIIPRKWRVKNVSSTTMKIQREFECGIAAWEDWAKKIDEVAMTDIRADSERNRRWIESVLSWDVLKPKYMDVFSKLCGKE